VPYQEVKRRLLQAVGLTADDAGKQLVGVDSRNSVEGQTSGEQSEH